MKHEQNFCRGAVVLSSGKPSLVVAVFNAGAVIVPLRPASLPHHRADVTMLPHVWPSMATACCAELSYEKFLHLDPLSEISSVCFGKKVMVRVDEAIRQEIASRTGERLPPGIVKSTLNPIFWSHGRNWWALFGIGRKTIAQSYQIRPIRHK